jgi:SynChlorMet cassette radical SAM/SPASM protein ScmF
MPCDVEVSGAEGLRQRGPGSPPLPEGVPPLSTLYFYVAGACNLACGHCWISPAYDPGAASGRFLPLDLMRRAILQGKPLGLASAKLTGGEPLLHPRFREIVSLCADEGLGINIETNGTLVDDGLARFLREKGVGFISVSLDGADAETHERLRGVPGSFARAVAGIRALAEAGLRPQAICTLHRGNAGQMRGVVALAGSLGCGSLKFNHVQNMGRGTRKKAEAGLDVEEVLALYRAMERDLVPRSPLPLFFDIPYAFRPIRALLRKDLGHCGILNILGVLSGGELSMCGVGVTVPDLIYGDLATDDLAEVWCNSPGLAEIRRLVPRGLGGACGRCLHRDFCMGECVAQGFFEEGRLGGAFPFCAEMDRRGKFPETRRRDSDSGIIERDRSPAT